METFHLLPSPFHTNKNRPLVLENVFPLKVEVMLFVKACWLQLFRPTSTAV